MAARVVEPEIAEAIRATEGRKVAIIRVRQGATAARQPAANVRRASGLLSPRHRRIAELFPLIGDNLGRSGRARLRSGVVPV